MTPRQPQREETVELEFSFQDERCFFVAASERAGCEIVGEEMVHRTDGNILEFFDVRGEAPETVLDIADDLSTVSHAYVVRERSDTALMAFVVVGLCAAATLAGTDAIIKRARAENGHGTVVADVPPQVTVREVVETFETAHPDSDLVAKRTLGETVPALSSREQNAYLTEDLTEKQFKAIKTATQYGYLSWPRESTATECAAALGISQPTFSQHLWIGLDKMLSTMFEINGGVGVDTP